MNLILYGSLAMVAFSKPWRAPACNFLDVPLGFTGQIDGLLLNEKRQLKKKVKWQMVLECFGHAASKAARVLLLHADEGPSEESALERR